MTKIRVDVDEFKRYKDAYDRWLTEPSAATKVAEEKERGRKKMDAFAQQIIDLLGLGGEYADVTTEFTYMGTEADYYYGRYGYPHYRPVERTGTRTDKGTDRFIADLAAATESAKGADALKRIKRAIKTARS